MKSSETRNNLPARTDIRPTCKESLQVPLHLIPLTEDEKEVKEIAAWLDAAHKHTEQAKFLRRFVREHISLRAEVAQFRQRAEAYPRLVAALRQLADRCDNHTGPVAQALEEARNGGLIEPLTRESRALLRELGEL